MSEELNVNQNTENLDEELDLELEEQVDTPSTGDVEADKDAKIAELERKNKQLFARLKKPQSKTNSQPTGESIVRDSDKRLSRLEQAEAKRQFGYEHGLSPEETDKVFMLTPSPTKETIEDPFVKAGLEAIRAVKRVNEATPSPSGRSTAHNGKTFAEMSPDERQAAMDAKFKR